MTGSPPAGLARERHDDDVDSSGEATIPLSAAEFRVLRDLLLGFAGIRFDDDTAFLLQRRLQPRLLELRLSSFSRYADYLRDPLLSPAAQRAELQALFERVATRETYLFRESYQLDALREEILPPLLARRRRGERLSLWSAGCSTGEEVYSLAITAALAGAGQGQGDDGEPAVQVLGTDLSQDALQVARAGVYGSSSFRQTSVALRDRYFEPIASASMGTSAPLRTGAGAAQRWRVRDTIRRMVRFQSLNLHQAAWEDVGGPHDVILCRNVLIYFDRALRPAVIARLTRCLAPGGYLLLGHSETLRDSQPGLTLCNLRHAQVYRRSEDHDEQRRT